MIVSIHQPHYFPWFGFVHKVYCSDLFVLLDTVDFRKNYYQNRVKILHAGEEQWLTVPVLHRSSPSKLIQDIRVNNRTNWRDKQCKTLFYAYGSTPHFSTLGPDVEALIRQDWEYLAPLNEATLRWYLSVLHIKRKIVRSSELQAEGAKSDLILDICSKVGATVYLSGPSGRDYLDEASFHKRRIEIIYQQFDHPAYDQGIQDFVPGLSLLDMLFRCGPEEVLAALQERRPL